MDAPFGLIAAAPNLGRHPNDVTKLVESIRAQCGRWGEAPGLVVLDTLSRSIAGLDESRSDDMMVFVDNALRLGRELGATIVPIHHCGKDEDRGMRGSSALHGAADGEWMVTRDNSTGARAIVVQKMRDGADQVSVGFSLKPVLLGKDVDGDAIETLVMDLTTGPEAFRAPLGNNEEILFRALRVLIQSEGVVPAGRSPAPDGFKAIDTARFREVVKGAGILPNVSPSSLSTLIPRYLEKLRERGMIGRSDDKLWLLTTPVSEG